MSFNHGQYSFNKDIITGEQGQRVIIDFMAPWGFNLISECHTSDYDLKMLYQGVEYTYEVKTDVYNENKTGNIVIEFECRGKSSGIAITKADYFVTYFPFIGEIWNIKCIDLRRLIEDLNPRVFSMSGDKGSNTKLYSFKRSDVRSYFKVHKLQ